MGAPYQRQDTTNNISNGNVINADDLDAEFDAIEDAFAVTTGHTHDGTAGEGGPISIVGFGQELTITGNQVIPKVTNTVDLGTSSIKFRDGYIDRVLYADSITLLSGDLQTTLDGKQPIDPALTALSGLVSSGDKLAYYTGIDTLALTDFSNFGRQLVDDVNAGAARTTMGLGTLSTQDFNAVNITGGTIVGITDLAIAEGGTGASTASAARTNLGLGTIATQDFSAVNITGGTITGITDLAVAHGGTGASTTADARINLGLEIGVNVQQYDPDLEAIRLLTGTGIPARTTANTWALRTIAAGTGISVTNPAGVAGDPTISVTGLTTAEIAAATLTTSSEGITTTNNNTTLPTCAAVISYVESNPWRYTSANQTITSGSLLTLAHSLGAKPTEVQVSLVCTTAQSPYAVGDELPCTDFSASGVQYGATASADATNIKVRTGAGGHILINDSGVGITLTNGSWRYVVRAR